MPLKGQRVFQSSRETLIKWKKGQERERNGRERKTDRETKCGGVSMCPTLTQHEAK